MEESMAYMGIFRIFPPDRMDKEFTWPIWAVGWLALFKAFLWLSYEPVQPQFLLTLLGTKYLLNMIPMAIFAMGVWNLRKWAVWGLMILSVANILFFIIYPQSLSAILIESEVHIYSIILSFITLLCNGPLGDILILLASPVLLKLCRQAPD
jgi:hypothetical protein